MRLKTLLFVAVFVFANAVFAQESITVDNADSAVILNDLSDEDRDFQGGAISPDGNFIAVSDIANDAVVVFEAESGDLILEIPYPEDVYTEIMIFNEDSSILTILWDSIAIDYDIETGEELTEAVFDFPLDYAGGRVLAVRMDTETEALIVYVTEDDEVIFETPLSGFFSASPSFSADGSTFAYADGGDVYVVDIDSGELGDPFVSIEMEYDSVESIALNSDGSAIAVSIYENYSAIVYDTESGDELYTVEFEENSSLLDNLIFSPDNSVLYMNVYNAVVLVDGTNGELLTFLLFPVQGRIAAFGMNDDGSTLFAASYEGLIVIGMEE